MATKACKKDGHLRNVTVIKERCRLNVRQEFVSQSVINDWNNIYPVTAMEAGTVDRKRMAVHIRGKQAY